MRVPIGRVLLKIIRRGVVCIFLTLQIFYVYSNDCRLVVVELA